jgi:hypothetical protein
MKNVLRESGEARLVAIYNTWSDTLDLLEHSIENILKSVDEVIVIWSENSNYGTFDASIRTFATYYPNNKVKFYQCEPLKGAPAWDSERHKRNFGLDKARQSGFSHFIMMDSDEFYFDTDVRRDLRRFEDPELKGLVCPSHVYFAKPTLTIGKDITLVPFIHKLTHNLKFEWNTKYPFAWDQSGPRKAIRIDPTRQLNIISGVEWSETVMHHYSWVRKDVLLKIRNSSAKVNIQQSPVLQDYLEAKEGYYCNFYGKELARCPNFFGLPE